MMADIKIARNAGFCFGVRRATGLLEEALKERQEGDSICTLGHIIHNDVYLDDVSRRGAVCISYDGLDAIEADVASGKRVTLVIRAHGEQEDVVKRLSLVAEKHPNFTLLNGTCPYVEKVRRIARENSGDGKVFMLIGAAEHPEVQGIMSCAHGEKYTFKNARELEAFFTPEKVEEFGNKTVSLAAQTTQKLSEWKKCLEIIKKVCTNPLIFDTICSVTEKRQTESAALAKESDIMLVIGSNESSNSRKLFEVTSEFCPRVYFVGGADDTKDIKIPTGSKLSITAGASTPDSVIQEVYVKMNEQMTENFAELLEASMKTLNTGDVVEGIVTSVSAGEIYLDLGAKTTGVIAYDKATTDPQAKLEDLFHVGDTVKAKVIKVSDIDGFATLDKTRIDSDKNWDKIVAAAESGEILEGKIVEAVKGGVIINLFSVKVFIPASLTGVPKDVDLHTIVGTTQKVKVIEIKADRKKAYASIKAVLREERRAKEDAFWASIEAGQEFDGVVRSLTSYGAFVDLGGVDGMVHNTELSWRRIKSPAEVVSVGDTIHVYVKDVDVERKRISLGYKTDAMNPWNIFTDKYAEGDVAEVKIVNLMPFGAFAEIVPGVDGLIHISQIADHKIVKPADELEIGQVVNAKITAIDFDNHKVSLSIRALLEEAADEADAEVVEEYEADAE
ncbi:MAG: 4-hydroxy-3-methylbut-2-enyl diphosphate reductase [Clostridia bacterium]|nr:4-hydroxy-3-methylbut-2-enyl diphosphate reductase [Clostridia bacterium]